MARRSTRPTDAELEILTVLWERGEATVRDVHETLSKRGPKSVGTTTILKLMQIMMGKGLITRDETRYPQIYSAVRSEEETQRLLATDLIDRAFRGSAHKLIMQALSEHKASDEELLAIRRLLEEHSGQ